MSTDSDFEFDPQAEYKEQVYEQPKPGWYIFMVDECTAKKSAKGNDMIAFVLKIISKDSPFCDRNVYEYPTFTVANAHNAQMFCRGVNPNMVSYRRDPANGLNYRSQESVDSLFLGRIFAGRVEVKKDKAKDGTPQDKARIVETRFILDNQSAMQKLLDWYGERRRPNVKVEREEGVNPDAGSTADDDCPF